MGEVIDVFIGAGVLLLIVGTTVGWLANLFAGSGGSRSEFDTKDPGGDY